MNTGSHKHVAETWRMQKKSQISGDLILRNMQSRHVLEEPQQLVLKKVFAFNLYLNMHVRIYFTCLNSIICRVALNSQMDDLAELSRACMTFNLD